MTTTSYFKAIRPDGRDFHSGTVQWAPERVKARKGRVVRHPTATKVGGDPSGYLSVATTPTDCTGMSWPCRLLEVETVDGSGPAMPHPTRLPHKRAAIAWRVVREQDPTLALGPQGAHVAALIERSSHLTRTEVRRLAAARDAAEDATRAARVAARNTRAAAEDAAWAAMWLAWNTRDGAWAATRGTRDAAWAAAGYAAWYAAVGAARALVVRDLIASEHYDALTMPWRQAVGRIHPDDEAVAS